jgi:hypothetical protein
MDLNFSPHIINQALNLLEDKCISMNGKTLSELGLQAPNRSDLEELNREILREKNYNVSELQTFVRNNKPLLLEEQRQAYNRIMNSIEIGNGALFFLDASGGTGKTFLINLLLAEIRMQNEIALTIASSGLSATLLEGGKTAHSALNLPLNIARSEIPLCNTSNNSRKGQLLKICKVIVWDECSMAHRKALEALDRTLRDIKGIDRPMGGAVIVLAGDFRQTLPVIPRSTPGDELHACIKASYLWRYVQKMTLSTNMRVHLLGDTTAQNFANQLLKLGNGEFPTDPTSNMISLPQDFCHVVSSVKEIVENVFPDIVNNYKNPKWLCERAILAPKNENINYINTQIQNELPGTRTTYKSIDTVTDPEQAVNYPTEFLNSLEPSGMPPHNLTLKVGSPIRLLRSLDPPKLSNGTRLCVKRLMPNIIEATILTGGAKGEDVFIPRIPLIPSDMPFDFRTLQYLVCLSFAMTINKAQGAVPFCCWRQPREFQLFTWSTIRCLISS